MNDVSLATQHNQKIKNFQTLNDDMSKENSKLGAVIKPSKKIFFLILTF